MNKLSDGIIDDFHHEHKNIILHSKLSIIILCIVLSPVFSIIPYSLNLWKTNQKDKIIGTTITIVVCYLCVLLPIIGFRIGNTSLTEFRLHNIVTLLFIVYPLWKQHFDDFEYTIKHYWLLIVGLIAAWISYIYMYYYLFPIDHYRSSFLTELILRPSSISLIFLLFYGLIIRYLLKIPIFIYKKMISRKS